VADPIAFCITELDDGGAERALVRLVCGLPRERWDPAVYVLSGPGPLAGDLERAGIPVQGLGVRSAWDLGVVGRLAQALKRRPPKLLQTWLYHANIAGRIAAWHARVPHVVAGIRVAERRSRWRLWADWLTSGLVERHVCVSASVAAFTAKRVGIPRSRIVVINNGVDVEPFRRALPIPRAELGIPGQGPLVISVGRLDEQKGLPDLLAAWQLVAERVESARLILVGDGPLRNLVQPPPERVHWLGRRNDVPRLLRTCQVFVLASRWEGMPNALLEAMAAGMPIVATHVDGVRDALRDRHDGVLVRAGAPRELAEAIGAMILNADLAARYGESAARRAEREFRWEAMIAAYDALYRELVSGRVDPKRVS